MHSTTQKRTLILMIAVLIMASGWSANAQTGKVIARGAESYGPVTPITTAPMSTLAKAPEWSPGDPIKEVPRRFFPVPGSKAHVPAEGAPDDLPYLQLMDREGRAPTISVGVNMDGQGYTGATPPDTVGDVGPNHYVQAVNASRIAIYDKTGTMLPGYPISLDSLAPSSPCTSGSGDPIVLYDWMADRWFLQEFTGGGTLCLYVSQTADPTGSYNFYSFNPPSFPDYPHYGVWPDAYYCTTNEDGSGGNQTTYAFDRVNMLAGSPATMQRLAVVPPQSGYGFQTLTPADHDGATPPPGGAPGIFMRHLDDEAHSSTPNLNFDYLELYEMTVDWTTPANTALATLPPVDITEFNSWLINYGTFYSVPQPGSGTLLDPIREAVLNRLVYRNFGSHETLLGVIATNRDPATSGSNVEAGARWFELRRGSGSGNAWALHQEGTFGGDTNSPTANFFMGSVAMDGAGNIALGYSKTDVGGTPMFPSVGYTGRLATDPVDVMGPENLAVAGTQASGSGRWGDYSAMSIDPEDDCTFWFTNEYMPGSNWGTRITSFVFEECLFGFFLSSDPAELDVCAATDPDPTFDIDVTSVGGWSFPVTLAASNEPPGTTSALVPNGQLPDFTSTYTILGTEGSTTGSYAIDITGTGADGPPTVRGTQVTLNLAVADPGGATLTAPANGAENVTLMPTFTWTAGSDAMSYDLEVATDPAFTSIVYSGTGITDTNFDLPMPLEPVTKYHWRVTTNNVCGEATSASYSFSTILFSCSSFPSTDVPLTIPEGGGTSGPTTSTVDVSAGATATIADLNILNVVGTHTWVGDLDFTIASPSATSVGIMGRRCSSDDDFNINFDDQAAPGDPPCPPTDGGTYQPASPLSAINGEDANGTWTLTINDNAAQDSGQLDSWSVQVCIEKAVTKIFADGFELGDTSAWTSLP